MKQYPVRILTSLLLLCQLFSVRAGADVKSFKIDPSGKVAFNDHFAKLWGLRTACAATNEDSTKQLIDSLKDYQSAGINMLLICYQGGPGLTSRAFSADGKSFEDTAVRDRMRRILDAANSKEILVVVSLFFPRKMGLGGQDPRLANREAYLAACRTAAVELKERNNVMICVADQPLASAFASCPMKFAAADIIECLGAVAAAAPNLPRGGGSAVHETNVTVAKAAVSTIIFHAEPGNAPPKFPAGKPIIHVGFAGTEGGRNPQGFYAPQARQPFLDLLDRYADGTTAHVIAHFPAWTEGGMDLKANRFDEGGQGTEKDPGLMWFTTAVSKHAKQRTPQTVETPTERGKSIFDNPG
jgi:hypothetical protein